jgi:HD-like signal output (HDOD) protein
MYDQQAFLARLRQAIAQNRITLPTLPEVALRVRDTVERETATAREIARVVSTDAAVSARLLQVVNSPLYRGRTQIDNIQMAVTRLGGRLVRSLVVCLAMQQIFQATSGNLDRRFRRIWENSVQVAAISRMLAKPLRHLDSEQAMLAGLLHAIGALPILVLADADDRLANDDAQLDFLLERLSPTIGRMILTNWDFPPALVTVAEHYNNFAYDGGPKATYTDVVIVARLQSLLGTDHPDAALNWADIRSFDRVGLEPDVEVIEMEGAKEQIAEVRGLFLA